MNDGDFYNNIHNYLKEWEDFKDLALTHKKLDKLQSNWNSLREWLEENEDKISYMEDVIDKMNELEGVDNENNNV